MIVCDVELWDMSVAIKVSPVARSKTYSAIRRNSDFICSGGYSTKVRLTICKSVSHSNRQIEYRASRLGRLRMRLMHTT